MSDSAEAQRDQWHSVEYAWACLRAELKAGRKLTPKEMDEAVQQEKAAHG